MRHFYRSAYKYFRNTAQQRQIIDWQRLKVEENPIELAMYDELKSRGYRVLTLYMHYDYEIDLVIKRPVLVAIECDGRHHLREDVQRRDQRKNFLLRRAGFHVIRLSSRDIFERPQWCANEVERLINDVVERRRRWNPFFWIYWGVRRVVEKFKS